MEHRYRALAVLCVATLMIVVDQTVVGVALPVLRADLGFTDAGLAWVVNGYVIPFGGFLLLSGRLGDLLGRRRVFLAGLALFTAASLAAGLATDAGTLVAARVAQGVGGALVSAVTLAMLVPLFPDPAERARALGVFSFVQAAGGSLGSVLGGVLTQLASWPWIFYVNLPIGVAAGLGARYLTRDRRGEGAADVLGGVLVTTGVLALVYAIVQDARVAVPAVLLLAGFVVREAAARDPLLPPRTFRSRAVAGANGVLALLTAAVFGFLFFGVLHLQCALGFDALRTGFGLVPVALCIGAVSLGLSARVVTRFGARPVLLVGLALVVVGLALFGRDASYTLGVLPSTLLLGVGFGLAMPALMGLGMAEATERDAGLVSGVFNTSQQVGGGLGLAVATAVAGADHSAAFLVCAGFALAALVLAAVVTRRDRPVRTAAP
ncbi:MFS transporter [Actinosynnema sp. NPDC020468]|uniref:MFS transporter n=1 Tax=Actinosynnema sp. NPDC020468 TaxID=3154488 RepID=UPI0033EC9DEF